MNTGRGVGTRPWYLIGLSPLLILTLCGPERVLVVSMEPPDGGGGRTGGYRGRRGRGITRPVPDDPRPTLLGHCPFPDPSRAPPPPPWHDVPVVRRAHKAPGRKAPSLRRRADQ